MVHTPQDPATAVPSAERPRTAEEPGRADGTPAARGAEEPRAACVLCQEPSEYPESHRGITLCPRCAWLEGQRTACSG